VTADIEEELEEEVGLEEVLPLSVTKTVPKAKTGKEAHWLGVRAWPSSQTANRAVGTILNDCAQIWKVTASRWEAATMTRICCATKRAAGTAIGLEVASTSLILFVTSSKGFEEVEEEEEEEEEEEGAEIEKASLAAAETGSGDLGEGGAPPTPSPLAPQAAPAAVAFAAAAAAALDAGVEIVVVGRSTPGLLPPVVTVAAVL